MYQNSVSKNDGDNQSVILLVPNVASSALLSLSNSKRSVIEKPMDSTGTLPRRLSTRRACECARFCSLNVMVSSNTVRPGFSSEGMDLNRSQVHS